MQNNRFFVTAWNEFGVNDLIITDSRGSVLGRVPQAVFGVSLQKPAFALYYDMLVLPIGPDSEEYEIILDRDNDSIACFVRELTITEVLQRAYATEADMEFTRLHNNLERIANGERLYA